MIRQLDDGTPDGGLRSRLCALIFLINKLPADGPAATGVRATAETLADLVVEDLTVGSATLRQSVPAVLQELVDGGTLMLVGDEYRLQTRESAEWETDYRARFARIVADDARIANDRSAALKNTVVTALRGLTFVQGASKTPRKYDLHFGPDRPPKDTGNVPVWVRDEWSISERTVREEAQAAGVDSPIVFVFLPRLEADELKQALARLGAAQETVSTRPVPQTPAGIEARAAMDSRAQLETQKVNGLVADIVKNARVYQGGGTEVVLSEGTFADLVKTAVNAALARLFPRFATADQVGWDKVATRASQGAADALTALGYGAEVEKQLQGLNVVLYFFSGIALFVGGFLILNSFNMTVLQRMREIGMLRAIGANRRTILGLILVEGLLQGLIGTLIGIALGYLLGAGLVVLEGQVFNQFLHLQLGAPVVAPLG
jgi:hypothetical protein